MSCFPRIIGIKMCHFVDLQNPQRPTTGYISPSATHNKHMITVLNMPLSVK